jgi:hypothetical protein
VRAAAPACGDAAIDAGDAMAALTDADVQDAFERSKGAATTPLYGTDPRVFDGQVFEITRDGGGGFMVGGPCPPGAPTSACTPIPGGLSRLVTVLTALDEQQLVDPICAAWFCSGRRSRLQRSRSAARSSRRARPVPESRRRRDPRRRCRVPLGRRESPLASTSSVVNPRRDSTRSGRSIPSPLTSHAAKAHSTPPC